MKSAETSRRSLSEKECFEKLRLIGQENLLKNRSHLSETLKEQITDLDSDLFRRLQQFSEPPSHSTLKPILADKHAGNEDLYAAGRKLAAQGKVALVVLAGGQGSRLRWEGPKGAYPVTPIQKKSLFRLLAEKVKAASEMVENDLEMAIMTSPLNHSETIAYFDKHAFFGLKPSQVTFFEQKMWPLLDFSNNLFLESPDQIAVGPNGNGGVFRRLIEAGIKEKWKKKGVEIVSVIPIDNPLADPFDFELCGFHAQQGCEIAVKSTLKRDAQENVGVVAVAEGKTKVVEYSELSSEEKTALDASGALKFKVANLGLFTFSLSFIEKIGNLKLPLHRAKKTVKALNAEGKSHFPEFPNAWKFEEFIFDALPSARKVEALLYPRALCFAPLKNLRGEDSIETVQQALLTYDRQVYYNVTGDRPPAGFTFELAPQFYYPTAEWLEKWKGKPFPNKDYIDE